MWRVERQLKSLKDFVRQRAHPKGSMVEGYMAYQCMVYISQYLPKLEENMNVLAFGISTPSTNLKGMYYWGKLT
jgi:hypothetical protein